MAYQFVRAQTQQLLRTGLPVTDQTLSLSCWFKPTAADQHMLLALQSTNLLQLVRMYTASGGQLIVQAFDDAGGGQNGTATTANAVTPNQWNHCLITNAPTARSARLNAGTAATSTNSVTFATLAQIRIGGALGITAPDGALAEAGFWTAALTDSEQLALARGLSPRRVRPASLLAYYPMQRTDRVAGSPALHRDRWRNDYTLTESGGAALAYADHPPVFDDARRRRVYVFVPSPPTTPALPSPADGATGLLAPDGAALSWTAFDAVSFDLYFGTATVPPLVAADLVTPAYVATGLLPGTTYRWRVVAKNSIGATSGAVWTFTTAAPPPAPTDPHPVDGALHTPAGTALSWAPVPGALYYRVYFGTTDPPPLVDGHWTATTFPYPDTVQGVRNYWRIEPVSVAGSTLGPVWSFVVTAGAVFVDACRIEQQFGPGFRSRLITEAFNIGTWPLAEQARLRVSDISGRNNHGTWVGTGFTSGIVFAVPEGCIGTRFTKNGYANIPDPAGLGGTQDNLSLAGGDMDHAILVKDYQTDGVKRALIAKHDGTRAAGDGWYLAVINGAVEYSLVVGGVIIFRFQRGTLTSAETLITACYRQVNPGPTAFCEAWIAFNGAIALPVVTFGALPPEPGLTAAPVRIGHFCDGVAGDGGGIDAALAYASIGREGDESLGPQLQLQRAWTNISPHVRSSIAVQTRTGISGSGPSDNVATSGTLNYTVDNGYRVPVGTYTPGHPNARAGLGIGNPVRLAFDFAGVTHYEFHGRLAAVTPLAGLKLGRSADCLVTDWIDVAAGTPMLAVQTLLNTRSDDVLRAVLDQAQGRVPVSVDIRTGSGTFPFAMEDGDSERETMLTELSRVVQSERGFAYITGDTGAGGRFVFEGHATRIGLPVRASFDNTMLGLEVQYALDALVNIVRITYTPRKVDGSVAVLYALDISQHSEVLQPGETRVFEGGYVDPLNEAESVGGTQIVPVTGTGGAPDIGFNAAANGGGANMIADLRIVQTLGGNSYRLELRNMHATAPGYLWLNATTGFQIRGKAIKHYKPATVERRDNSSVRTRGPRLLDLDLPYESDSAVATALAEFYLELYGTEQPIPSSLRINGNRSASMMRAALGLQPGDKIALGEPLTGLSIPGGRAFIIHEKRLEYSAPGIVFATFALAPAPVSLTLRRTLGSQSAAA